MTTISGTTTTEKPKVSFWSKIPKPSLKTIVIFILVLLMVGSVYECHRQQIKKAELKLINEENLAKALDDSVHHYINKYGEVVNEKLTIQTSLSAYQDSTKILTSNQKDLLQRIKSTQANVDIISAALVKSKLIIDSLMNITAGTYDSKNNTINFEDSVKDMQFDITITNAKPFDLTLKTGISFNHIVFPNTQYITFQWNKDKKLDYPVSFSITNSNKYLMVTNIDSYEIPQIKHDTIKPTFWQQVGKFFKDNKNILFGIIGGGVVGYCIGK